MEIVSVHQVKKYFGKGENQVKALDGIDLSIGKIYRHHRGIRLRQDDASEHDRGHGHP